jgi:hypothetical protein
VRLQRDFWRGYPVYRLVSFPKRSIMSKQKTTDNLGHANTKTEADMKSADGRSGQSGKSSHDHMSNVKAGSQQGAGGGAKQLQRR